MRHQRLSLKTNSHQNPGRPEAVDRRRVFVVDDTRHPVWYAPPCMCQSEPEGRAMLGIDTRHPASDKFADRVLKGWRHLGRWRSGRLAGSRMTFRVFLPCYPSSVPWRTPWAEVSLRIILKPSFLGSRRSLPGKQAGRKSWWQCQYEKGIGVSKGNIQIRDASTRMGWLGMRLIGFNSSLKISRYPCKGNDVPSAICQGLDASIYLLATRNLFLNHPTKSHGSQKAISITSLR